MKYLIILLLVSFHSSFAQYTVLTQRDQAKVIDEILDDRLRNLLPGLMRREGFDMWVIISREYNEDPIIKTLLPATWMAARRTTMLVAFDKGTDMEYLAVARYDVGKVFMRAWDPDANPDQWAQLGKIIAERNPKKIGVNKAPSWGHADGLSSNDYDRLLSVLPKELHPNVVSAEKLAVAWLETRSEREVAIYPEICRIAHNIIAEGFSAKVIKPGITTTEDVVWWYRERIKELKLDTWFHTSVSIQRNEPDVLTSKRPLPLIILPGDLLHVDFGITYLRLNTDTQQHAYVLKAGEKEAPRFLRDALKRETGYKTSLLQISKKEKQETRSLLIRESRPLLKGLRRQSILIPSGIMVTLPEQPLVSGTCRMEFLSPEIMVSISKQRIQSS